MESEPLKKKKDKKENKKKATNSLNSSKSAQMIFKTALRNHIDLTSIADNKANIMLSINALIITISMPLLAARISDSPQLLIPSAILLLSCMVSIIYATLATRPIATNGITTEKQIEEGKTNLFFFGNFHAMNYDNYKQGVKQVIVDDDKLDDSITRDLFFLGKALGEKFRLLRVCYTVFMIGIVLSVISFSVVVLIFGGF
ncbi:MAG: Pycsar system effector family protein [Saprospiraceae bacterium]